MHKWKAFSINSKSAFVRKYETTNEFFNLAFKLCFNFYCTASLSLLEHIFYSYLKPYEISIFALQN